jgi:hypothetical protein
VVHASDRLVFASNESGTWQLHTLDPKTGSRRRVTELATRVHPHEVYILQTGHAAFAVQERIRQIRGILGLLPRHVPGVTVPTA